VAGGGEEGGGSGNGGNGEGLGFQRPADLKGEEVDGRGASASAHQRVRDTVAPPPLPPNWRVSRSGERGRWRLTGGPRVKGKGETMVQLQNS
jgi:hypothetical protein